MMTRTRDGSRETVARSRRSSAATTTEQKIKTLLFRRRSVFVGAFAGRDADAANDALAASERRRASRGVPRETRARERGAPCGPRRLPRRKTVVVPLNMNRLISVLHGSFS